jgi:hypothetical protein
MLAKSEEMYDIIFKVYDHAERPLQPVTDMMWERILALSSNENSIGRERRLPRVRPDGADDGASMARMRRSTGVYTRQAQYNQKIDQRTLNRHNESYIWRIKRELGRIHKLIFMNN